MYSLCRKSIYIHEKSVYNIDVERAEAITEGGVANEVQRVPEAQPGASGERGEREQIRQYHDACECQYR